ncbi:hypothetical protein QO004_003064 [Rhizobium mesoamericanum]|nr:hypothetical protein [Rhizobium mesoamericanum]
MRRFGMSMGMDRHRGGIILCHKVSRSWTIGAWRSMCSCKRREGQTDGQDDNGGETHQCSIKIRCHAIQLIMDPLPE